MVDGVSNYSKDILSMSRVSNLRTGNQESGLDNQNTDLNDLQNSLEDIFLQSSFSGSLDIKLDMTKSMQIVESESRRSISRHLALEFNLSVDSMGKIGGNFVDSKAANKLPSSKLDNGEDPFSAENTANRIVDFVKRAAELTKSLGISGLENENEKNRFENLQIGAVKEGFKQARSILGDLDKERDDRVNSTYDLVMNGLDRYFHPEKYEHEEKLAEENSGDLTSSNSSIFGVQSFSLNFQLSMSVDGVFDETDLNDYIGNAFSEVKNIFDGYLRGEPNEEDFNPLNVFQLGKLHQDRVRTLVED